MNRALLPSFFVTAFLVTAITALPPTCRGEEKVIRLGSIEELCRKVDGVLLESVDGRPHLEQVRPVIAAGKPVFIDKPMAANLADVIEKAKRN